MFYIDTLDTMFYISLESYINPIVYSILKKFPKIIKLDENKVYKIDNPSSYTTKKINFKNEKQTWYDNEYKYYKNESSYYNNSKDTYFDDSLLKDVIENEPCEMCQRSLPYKEGFFFDYNKYIALCNDCYEPSLMSPDHEFITPKQAIRALKTK